MVRFAKFSALSVYTHGEAHLLQKTYHGAIVTICGAVLALMLFMSEMRSCLHTRVVQEMEVDQTRGDVLQLRVNMTLPMLPCQALNVDLRDISGVRESDSKLQRGGGVHKVRINRYGQRLGVDYVYPGHTDFAVLARDRQIVEELESALNAHEGCNIYCFMNVQRVAGTLVATIHLEDFFALPENQAQLRAALRQRMQGHPGEEPHPDAGLEVDLDTTRINVTHVIHEVSFGSDYPGQVKPLTDVTRVAQELGGTYRYYLKVVPTKYKTLRGRQHSTNQYSVTEYFTPHRKGDGKLPGIYLLYDISPIAISLREERKGVWHFLVRLCAVVGGVFAVTGMVDRWVHRAITAAFEQPKRPAARPRTPPPAYPGAGGGYAVGGGGYAPPGGSYAGGGGGFASPGGGFASPASAGAGGFGVGIGGAYNSSFAGDYHKRN